jgi:hypothetical protein
MMKKQRDWILEDRKERNWNDINVEMVQSLAAIRPMKLPALRFIDILSGNAYMNNSHLERMVEDLVVGVQNRVAPYPRLIAEYHYVSSQFLLNPLNSILVHLMILRSTMSF